MYCWDATANVQSFPTQSLVRITSSTVTTQSISQLKEDLEPGSPFVATIVLTVVGHPVQFYVLDELGNAVIIRTLTSPGTYYLDGPDAIVPASGTIRIGARITSKPTTGYAEISYIGLRTCDELA